MEQGVSPDNIIILDFVKYGGKYDTNIIDSRIVKKHILREFDEFKTKQAVCQMYVVH